MNVGTGTAFECKEYTNKGQKQTVTVAIVPIRLLKDIDTEGREDVVVSNGCSFHWTCENLACTYSKVAHDQAKSERDKRKINGK